MQMQMLVLLNLHFIEHNFYLNFALYSFSFHCDAKNSRKILILFSRRAYFGCNKSYNQFLNNLGSPFQHSIATLHLVNLLITSVLNSFKSWSQPLSLKFLFSLKMFAKFRTDDYFHFISASFLFPFCAVTPSLRMVDFKSVKRKKIMKSSPYQIPIYQRLILYEKQTNKGRKEGKKEHHLIFWDFAIKLQR